jgi:soluble lytic murein transglycosylase-like protein
MRTDLEDPLLVASVLTPWLAAPIALMLLLKPTTARAALTPTTTKFTRPPSDILNALKVASQKTGVPLPILIGVAHTETRYKPYLTSNKGAAGLMQLMPKTAESLGVTNRLDPMQSALGGAKLLKIMYSAFGNWDQALAAYNWGRGNVNRNPEPSQWIPRTRTYVANVQYVAENVR